MKKIYIRIFYRTRLRREEPKQKPAAKGLLVSLKAERLSFTTCASVPAAYWLPSLAGWHP